MCKFPRLPAAHVEREATIPIATSYMWVPVMPGMGSQGFSCVFHGNRQACEGLARGQFGHKKGVVITPVFLHRRDGNNKQSSVSILCGIATLRRLWEGSNTVLWRGVRLEGVNELEDTLPHIELQLFRVTLFF